MIKSRTDEWKNTLHQDISNVFFVVYITQLFINSLKPNEEEHAREEKTETPQAEHFSWLW